MKISKRLQSCQSFKENEEKTESDDYITQKQQQSRLKEQKSLSPNNTIKKKKKTIPNTNLVANLSDTKYIVVKNVMKKHLGLKITKQPMAPDWDLYWTDNVVVPEQLARMKPYQKINHFPGMFTLSRKNYLARNLSKMAKEFPIQYDFYPRTWILPSELSELRNYMETETNPVVIVKPEASCQGKGIFLSKSIDDFDYGEHYVVQKYLKKPLIIDGLKFDLRVYVLVAGCDPLRLYIYEEGLARFATQTYSTPKKENLGNLFMHLTNYSINKNSEKFEFNHSKQQMDKGHKRSLTSIATRLGEHWEKIWLGTKDIIVKTLISTQPILKHHYRSCQPENYANNMCFQILGFDIIIDSNLNPMLLEVNYTPSFAIDTPLDKMIKQNLIKESMILMNLTGKAKHEILLSKKREMNERTLTGKKVWYSKEEREKIVQKCQRKRDVWENAHLKRFQKIFPVSQENQTKLHQQYQQYLAHSQSCYENITGANIRRNQKVIKNPISSKEVALTTHLIAEKGQSSIQGGSQQQLLSKDNLKLTNTQQLAKIYKASMKPILPRRKRELVVNKTTSGKITSTKSVMKKPPTFDEHNNTAYNSKVASVKNRATSAIKRSGVSNVYNITFKGKQ